MLAVFLFHCTRFFDPEEWYWKNAAQSELLFVSMRGLIWTWVMELFFLLSGVGTWYSLGSRRAGSYVWERVKRLLIPLYLAGFNPPRITVWPASLLPIPFSGHLWFP